MAEGFAGDGGGVTAHFRGFLLEAFDGKFVEIDLIDVGGWDEEAPAGGPVWAAHAGAGDADGGTYKKEEKDGNKGGGGEFLIEIEGHGG